MQEVTPLLGLSYNVEKLKGGLSMNSIGKKDNTFVIFLILILLLLGDNTL